MMKQLLKNGELTQADVDQANTDAEEAKNAVTEQESQGRIRAESSRCSKTGIGDCKTGV